MNREALGFGLNLTSTYLEPSLSDFLANNLDLSVAHAAHIGGFLSGLLLWSAWLRKGRVNWRLLSFVGLGTSVTLSNRKSIRSYLLADSNLTPTPEKLQERGFLESRTTTKSDHILIEQLLPSFGALPKRHGKPTR